MKEEKEGYLKLHLRFQLHFGILQGLSPIKETVCATALNSLINHI